MLDITVEHVEVDGAKITTHLYLINDADEAPRYAFNAVVEAPSVERFDKPKNENEMPIIEEFGFIVVDTVFDKETHEAMIDAGARVLKRHCEIKDPNEFALVDAHTILGLDEFVDSKLKELSQLEEGSKDFQRVWEEINTYMVKSISESIKTIYERAGVSDLVYKGKDQY